MEKIPKNPQKFSCEKCTLNTSNRKDYEKHLLTAKHLSQSGRYAKISKIPKNPFFCDCGNEYKHSSGLWRHKKTCTVIKTDTLVNEVNVNEVNVNEVDLDEPSQAPPEDFKTLTSMVIELMKSNTELQKQLVDACKANSTVNNSVSHINSHNKTFNLQFFLNEQCKDAMNISDFANSFELQLSDLESVGELGYVEGITKIMVDKLNSMDIYKRPIHCSDAKREILYVKDDNKWEKEQKNNPKLRYAIKTISFRNMKLANLWSDTYPESKNGESHLNDVYMKLIKESTGGNGEIADSENKIIRRIAKEIIIDKSNLM
jgi:hypothetical protein